MIEYRMRHKDGHYVRLRAASVTLTDGDGNPSRRISFLRGVEAADHPTAATLGSKPTE